MLSTCGEAPMGRWVKGRCLGGSLPHGSTSSCTLILLQEKDLRDVGDWRKNIEEKSGMEGRKKMFEAGES